MVSQGGKRGYPRDREGGLPLGTLDGGVLHCLVEFETLVNNQTRVRPNPKHLFIYSSENRQRSIPHKIENRYSSARSRKYYQSGSIFVGFFLNNILDSFFKWGIIFCTSFTHLHFFYSRTLVLIKLLIESLHFNFLVSIIFWGVEYSNCTNVVDISSLRLIYFIE